MTVSLRFLLCLLALGLLRQLSAESFANLSQFDQTDGWQMVQGAYLDKANPTQLTLVGAEGGILSNGAKKNPANYLKTKSSWGDHDIFVEFMIPEGSNSGFYVLGRYEVQVFDSHGKADVTFTDMGGIYQRWDDARGKLGQAPGYEGVAPMKNMAQKPGQWNHLNIRFKAPRFNEFGEKISHAQFLEVKLNGEVVQEAVEVKGPTRSHPVKNESATGSLFVQGDHGPVAIRNLRIEERNYDSASSTEVAADAATPVGPNGKPLVELVAHGKEAFVQKGCIECHTYAEGDAAIKTGPPLYGLFRQEPTEHVVVDGTGQGEVKVIADEIYFGSSVRSSNLHLALSAEGQPYLPIMPSYSEDILTGMEVRALYAYLKTLNPPDVSGPSKVYEPAEKAPPYNPDLDPQSISAADGTKVVRALVRNGTSARAIHVGQQNGQNYAFDPHVLSVKAIWTGRFLDLREDINGRGGKFNELAQGAKKWPWPFENLLRPLREDGQPFDGSLTNSIPAELTFPTVPFQDRVEKLGGGLLSYTSGDRPTIAYWMGKNTIRLTFFVAENGHMEARIDGEFETPQTFTFPAAAFTEVTVSGGELNAAGGVWTVPPGKQDLTWNAIPAGGFPSEATTRAPVVVSAPFAWQLGDGSEDVVGGYQVFRADAPMYSTGVRPFFEPTAIDFDDAGTPYVGTRTAGIWTIREGQWHPFALGTYDVLGLEVVGDGELVVCQKPEVTRISDTDGDGTADKFVTLCAEYFFGGNYHAYNHGPAIAEDGSVHFNLNLQHVFTGNTYNAGGSFMGTMGGLRGRSCRIDPSGKLQSFASGLRSPAGIAFSPKGGLYYTDNQGEYMSTSKLFRLREGAYYGHPSSLVDDGKTPAEIDAVRADLLKGREVAAVLLPHNLVANSPGNPAWDTTGGKFGPFAGQMFVGDQTLSNIHRIHLEEVDGVEQGSIMPFLDRLPSGPMRLRFSSDGELWVGQTGRGWISKGGKLSAMQKVVWSGEGEMTAIHRIESNPDGFEIFFTHPLPEDEQKSFGGLGVNSWFYIDSEGYGSEEHDRRVEIVSGLEWAAGGASVKIEVEGIRENYGTDFLNGQTSRVYQFDLRNTGFGKDLSDFHKLAYYTLNWLP